MEQEAVEILLVEDNPNDAELTKIAFKDAKISNKFYHVKDGEEALELLFKTGRYKDLKTTAPLKLILLDLRLPKVDGIDVLKRIKADPSLKVLPIVILTSSREEKDIVESYQLGVNSYIIKPVDFEKFVEAVKQLSLYWVLYNESPSLRTYERR